MFAGFIARLEELGEDAVSDPAKPSIGLEGVEPTPALLAWAEHTQHELDTLKRKRESHIQAMYDQLESLWKRMSVPEREMDGFVEANRGSTEETIRAYEEELDRMLELKRERMSTFVENARAEIEKLWEDLMVGETERADFAPFADGEWFCGGFISPFFRECLNFWRRRTHRGAPRDPRRRDPTVEGGATNEGDTTDEHQEVLRHLPGGERLGRSRCGPDASPGSRTSRPRETPP